MIYFDNAATSLPKPPAVGAAMLEALAGFGGAGRGGHPAALAASRCVFQARQAVAELLGSAPERTVFTGNATDSLNLAIRGLLAPGDHVITTALEHNSVLRPLYRLRDQRMELTVVGADGDGRLDYGGFRRSLQPNTKAVVCTHASNVTGMLVDLDFVTGFCRENGLLLILDASQTAGVFPIHADRQGVDALCFTGHKGLFGPQGIGGLCLGRGIRIAPDRVGGSGQHSFSEVHPDELPDALEAGTLNAHGVAGLLAGVRFIQETGMDALRAREQSLTRRFLEGVCPLPGVRVYGDHTGAYAPIATLNIAGIHAGAVGDMLAGAYEICVRTGAHCAPLAHLALGTGEAGAVRFSFSYFNTEDEIDAGIRAIAEIAHEGV